MLEAERHAQNVQCVWLKDNGLSSAMDFHPLFPILPAARGGRENDCRKERKRY
jgi:hypothetical protein